MRGLSEGVSRSDWLELVSGNPILLHPHQRIKFVKAVIGGAGCTTAAVDASYPSATGVLLRTLVGLAAAAAAAASVPRDLSRARGLRPDRAVCRRLETGAALARPWRGLRGESLFLPIHAQWSAASLCGEVRIHPSLARPCVSLRLQW